MSASMPHSVRARRMPAGTVVDRYQLLHRVAAGGMGTVYAARAVGVGGFERLLAVKVLHPHLAEQERFVTMFLDEARLAARIHHPNVVSTLDVLELDGNYYLVMDYIEGMELATMLPAARGAQTRLPVPIVLRIVVDALQGLAAAHALCDRDGTPLNLIHRDVSPQNILVGADGIARLTDFGVAKAEHRLSETRGGEFKGKMAYAAPEQLERSETEQRSDIFAMGVVLWEAITHRRLFHADDKFGVMRKVLDHDITPPSRFNPRLAPFDAVLKNALERDPARRTQTAGQLIEQIEEAAAAHEGVARPAAVAEWVSRLGGEELQQRRAAIRAAAKELGDAPPWSSSSAIPVNPGAGAFDTHSTAETLVEGRSSDQVSHMAPLGSTEARERGRRRTALLVVAVIAAIALLAGAVALGIVLGGEDHGPAPVAAPAEPPARTGPGPEEPVAAEPTPEEPVPAEPRPEEAEAVPPTPTELTDQPEEPAGPGKRPVRTKQRDVLDNPYRNL